MGKWQDALEFAEQEIEIGKNTGQLIAVSWAERNLADACYGLGDLRSAKGAIQQALDMAKAMGNFRLAVHASARLSIIQTDLGQVELAEQNARSAVEQASDFHQILIMAWSSLYALAYWHVQRGDWEDAFEHLNQAADIIAETDNRGYLLLNDPLYAEASLRVGKIEKATAIVERTLTMAREAPSPHIEAVIRRVQAQILAAQGSWDEAARTFDDAIAQLDQLGSRLELGRALYHRGEMQVKREQVDGAHTSLVRALEIFQDCSAKSDVERTHAALASLEACT
jgi:tetratricopeptide (TPR) repeat protein